MHHLRDFHVVAAVLGNLQYFALFVPLQSLQAVGNFLGPKRGVGDRVELEAMGKFLLKIDHQVERGELSEVERRVAVQHLIVKPDVVESHDEVRPL